MQADVNNYNNKDTKVKKITAIFFVMLGLMQGATAQTTYDSTTLVDTNNTSNSTSTVNSNSTSANTNTNNNNNVSTSTNTNTNTNVNTNHNINSGETTTNVVNSGTVTNNNNNNSVSSSTNNNNNNNVNTSTSVNRNIQEGTLTNRNINETEMTVKQPPPTAVAPAMMSGGNNDLCTTGTSGAVQTQILGVSSGGTVRDMNCERLKNSKTLYDMGMKVAAVATMCQDRRVFDAMWDAGTPCPFEGEIGEKAKKLWQTFPEKIPAHEKPKSDDFYKKTGWGALLGVLLFGLL
jgi:hypothetical protein